MTSATKLPWLLVSTILLGGCGSGPQPRQAAERTSVAGAPDQRPVIAAFGDSLTEGYGVDESRSYPAVLQRELDRRGHRYRVVNLGVSGDTSTDGLARLDQVLALRPRAVVLEFGANDGLRGLPVSLTEANLDKMIAGFRQASVTVILAGMTLPPNYGSEYIRPFEAIFRDLAAKHGLTLIPFLLEGVAGTTAYMQSDGLHPNADGCAKVAETVLRHLEPQLNATATR